MFKEKPSCYECGVEAEKYSFNDDVFLQCPLCHFELDTRGMPTKSPKERELLELDPYSLSSYDKFKGLPSRK